MTVTVEHDLTKWDEWPEDTLVVIPCSGQKLKVPAPVDQIYTGPLFRLALRAARSITDDDRIRVLSGKWGLLKLTDEIWPYYQRIDHSGHVPIGAIAGQLLEPNPTVVVALTPKAYTAALTSAVGRVNASPLFEPPTQLVTPLAGCRGIGEMRRRLLAIEGTVRK